MTETPGKEGAVVAGPVSAVLVMEDRAQVTRRATVDLEAGRHTLVVEDLTPLVADATVRVRFAGEPAGRILDLAVRRRYVMRAARPEKEKELTETLRERIEDYRAGADHVGALHQERELIGKAAAGCGEQIRNRLVVGPFEPGWKDDLDLIWSRRARAEDAILERQWSQDDRELEIRRLEEERRAVQQPVTEYRARLVTEVSIPERGTYTLEWDYQVPCALWRPMYTAELVEEEQSQVAWTSCGCVWQLTGEDWSGVTLSFSTARPTLGGSLPLLEDDRLTLREKTVEEKKTLEVTSRDEEIAVTSTAPEAHRADTPPGLDDGGEVRTYVAPGRVDVPSDGRPHRLPFESWTAEVEAEFACVPEKEPYVFLRSVQTNPSALPLLAGPVSLIRNGGFVGRASIGFVAAREAFALSWGSEDGLVVLREQTRKHEEKGLRKQHVYAFEVRVYLANHAEQARRVKLTERVPVSEIKQVEVAIDRKKSTPGGQTDDQGRVSWELDLAPGAEKTVDLQFTVTMPHHVRWSG